MDLSKLSVEEFMSVDWGQEDEKDEEKTADVSIKKVNIKKKKKKVKIDSIKHKGSKELINKLGQVESHQVQLKKLKEKDPEFYEFLQQEDSALLNFDEKDFDIDEDSDEDEENTGIHQLPTELEEASDSEMEYGSDEDGSGSDDDDVDASKEKKHPDRIQVTGKMVEDWKSSLLRPKCSISSLREVMMAFHSAIERFSNDKADKKKKEKLKYRVDSGSTFNAVVGMCLRHVVPSLVKILDFHPEKAKKKQNLPSHCKSWSKVRETLRYYLADVISLNQILLEPSVVCACLRHTILLLPYFMSFPKICKTLMKFLIKSWSSAEDESVRVLSFFSIIRITKLEKKKYLEYVLKQTYLAYVANCKFTTPSLLPMINFMQRTLCELFAIDPSLTYQLAFLYIRQLAIHLRKAMSVCKKETYQAVYNWQYIHCLGLWCRVVGDMYNNDSMKPLLYPLVQVSIGTIELVPTARYFPLLFHVVRYLTSLSDATNTYIPLLPFITRPLRLPEFSKKKTGLMTKPITFSTILKLSNSQLKEKAYKDTTMDEIYDVLMEYVNTQAHTISFPELLVPTMLTLKKFSKNCKAPAYSKLVRQIVEKVQENSKFITEKRSNVSFAVTDLDAVASWEFKLKQEGVPFNKHQTHYKKMRTLEKQQAAADKDRIVEERLPTIDRKKFMNASKAEDRKKFEGLFTDDNEETLDEIEINLEKLAGEGKSRKKRARTPVTSKNDSDSDEGLVSSDEDITESVAKSPVKRKVEQNSEISLKKRKSVKRPDSKKKKIVDGDTIPDIVEDFNFSSDDDA